MTTSYRFSSIQEIHHAYLTGEASVQEVTQQFLTAIDRYDPYLHAVIEVSQNALEAAKAMDKELQHLKETGAPLPLLFGIPVLLKDNISTAGDEKLHTSAGAAALGDLYAPEDAPCIRNLRAAGALILGKANLSEFANYYTEGNPNGWSARGGQCVHPYEPATDSAAFLPGTYHQEEHFDPSGSSTGSAVAVAAGLCTVAHDAADAAHHDVDRLDDLRVRSALQVSQRRRDAQGR